MIYFALWNLGICYTWKNKKSCKNDKSKISHPTGNKEFELSDYQQDSKVLYIFVPSKSFGQLSDISPRNVTILKNFDPKFLYTEVWFTDQCSKPIKIEDKINITLVIN